VQGAGRERGRAHGWDIGLGIAADPTADRVFVTGFSSNRWTTREDYTTIAYQG